MLILLEKELANEKIKRKKMNKRSDTGERTEGTGNHWNYGHHRALLKLASILWRVRETYGDLQLLSIYLSIYLCMCASEKYKLWKKIEWMCFFLICQCFIPYVHLQDCVIDAYIIRKKLQMKKSNEKKNEKKKRYWRRDWRNWKSLELWTPLSVAETS